MFGVSITDIIVVVLFFAINLYIGFRAMKHVKNQEDYFLGGRKFGKIVQIFTIFGQATSTDTAIGTTTTTYTNGASGIWSQLGILFATPVYWFTAPWYRRFRYISLSDFFEERFGSKNLAAFYAVISTVFVIAILGLGMKSLAVTVQGITPKSYSDMTKVEKTEYNKAFKQDKLKNLQKTQVLSASQQKELNKLQLENPQRTFSYVNQNLLIAIVCIIVLIYTVTGGLEAAMYTDTLQGMLTFILSIILIPFAIIKLGHLYNTHSLLGTIQAFHNNLPAYYFDIFGSPYNIDFTWYFILTVAVISVINVHVQPNQLSAMGSAKDENTARIGCIVGSFLKRFCIVLWCFTGLLAFGLYFHTVNNPDIVWGYTVRDLLTPAGCGLVGLMASCLLAALMSTASVMMITAAGLITRSVYTPLFPNRSEKHYVLVGRVVGFFVIIAGALIATSFDSILQMLKFIWEFNSILAAAFWCGILWKKANKKAAWTSMIIAALLFVAIPAFGPMLAPSLRTSKTLLTETKPVVISKIYKASEIEVQQRNDAIKKWDSMTLKQREGIQRPKKIKLGDSINKRVVQASRAIFWSEGLRIGKDGKTYGSGLFYINLYIVSKFINLTDNSYALNETIRTWIKIILPFIVVILVSLFTKGENKKRLDKFYVKMRTPVHQDLELDHKELEVSYSNPNRYSEKLMFRNSNIMCLKWTSTDWLGLGLTIFGVFIIIGFLYLLMNLV